MDELLNTAPCGFVSFSDDGTLLEVNQTLASILGYERAELAGWHIEKLLPPGGRIFYHTYLFPMLKVQGSVDEIYAAVRTKSGADVPMLVNGVRKERDGRVVNDCVFVRMIQRHAFEAQLLQARKLAEESSAAKAKFLSMMSHDLRTPLAAIDGNAQVLQTEIYGPLNAEQQDVVRVLRDACRTQLSLMNDILEFARLESGHVHVQPRPLRVADVVTRAERLMKVLISEAGLVFVTDDHSDGAAVMADPDRLQQVLLNLLTNAIKFTPSGGEIALRCERDGDRVRIHVRDTGIGIAAEHLQAIFSPFVQIDASASSRGVGLGLAISRDLARAMSGEVTAASAPGVGSVFTVELPAAEVIPESAPA